MRSVNALSMSSAWTPEQTRAVRSYQLLPRKKRVAPIKRAPDAAYFTAAAPSASWNGLNHHSPWRMAIASAFSQSRFLICSASREVLPQPVHACLPQRFHT